jgi:hypothetical protein
MKMNSVGSFKKTNPIYAIGIKPKAPVFARQGSKNLLKNDSFLPISTQKARIFANFLPLFTHFCQFLTKFFLPILPKPHNLTPPPLFFVQKQ